MINGTLAHFFCRMDLCGQRKRNMIQENHDFLRKVLKGMRKAILAVMLVFCMLLPLSGAVYAAGMENFLPQEEVSTIQFQDVPEGAWYEEALERC